MILAEEKEMTFKNKNILVVGLARSGAGAANLLSVLGAKVTVTDRKPRSSLEGYISKLLPEVNLITEGNPPEVFEGADMIVVSPGVPLYIPPLVHAKAKGVPIISELELAYQIIQSRACGDGQLQAPAFIGITGTNGKSTTTTLIDVMLREAGYRTLLGGNIGNALTGEILKTCSGQRSADYIVAEISSFQLEAIEKFRPGVAAILNISPDHLDRYENMEDYISAKAEIFRNQMPEDRLILNADDPVVMGLYNSKLKTPGTGRFRQNSGSPQSLFFSRRKEVEGVYAKEGMVYCNLPDLPSHVVDLPLVSVDEIRIKGVHNLENAMAASLAALVSGCSCEAVRNVLKDFSGLEHRLEFVGEIDGVTYINDSKGTNTGAVAMSLESFNDVVLIMGGLDKGSDFSVLRDMVGKKVKHLILLGEAKDKIADAIGTAAETHKTSSLEEAVRLSASKAVHGDVVMLSPACASFDMFADFEDRGRKFKEAVRKLKK
jgi:UDP-N-acetylmuramoylalanine--D-glutamate ligase